jgi:hypothetical protein
MDPMRGTTYACTRTAERDSPATFSTNLSSLLLFLPYVLGIRIAASGSRNRFDLVDMMQLRWWRSLLWPPPPFNSLALGSCRHALIQHSCSHCRLATKLNVYCFSTCHDLPPGRFRGLRYARKAVKQISIPVHFSCTKAPFGAAPGSGSLYCASVHALCGHCLSEPVFSPSVSSLTEPFGGGAAFLAPPALATVLLQCRSRANRRSKV